MGFRLRWSENEVGGKGEEGKGGQEEITVGKERVGVVKDGLKEGRKIQRRDDGREGAREGESK